MPGALIERPKMTRSMYQALKRHIMRERERKKQEQEQDEAMERQKQEKEKEKKKQAENSLTLEQTKEQISQLETQVETLKQEKHELFSQLKKVLHQEDESRKRAQMKEQSELMTLTQQYPSMSANHQAMYMQQQRYMQRPMMTQGIKRSKSPPTPPPQTSIYGAYAGGGGKYPATTYSTSTKQEHYGSQKPGTYPGSQSTQVTYVTQAGHSYQQQRDSIAAAQQQKQREQQRDPQRETGQPSQSSRDQPAYASAQTPAGKYSAQSSSAFSSYASHYGAHPQKAMADPAHAPGHYQPGFPLQRGYSPHTSSSLPLQQQLEHANQKSGFNDDKFKMQQQIRGVTPLPHQQQLMPAQGSSRNPSPSPQAKSITGYPVRSQPTTTAYVTSTSQAAYSSSQASHAPRHSYQGGFRY